MLQIGSYQNNHLIINQAIIKKQHANNIKTS